MLGLYREHSQSNSTAIYKKAIWIDMGLFLTFCFIGWTSIFSIEYRDNQSLLNILNGQTNYSKQFIWIGIAFVLGIVTINFNSKIVAVLSYPLYSIGIALMVITIFFGQNMRGSKSWLSIGGVIKFQSAQIMFLFTLLALSKYLANNDIYFENWKKKIASIVIIILPMILTLYQSETGLALVYISLLVVLYREGISIAYLILPFYFLLILILYFIVSPIVFDISIAIVFCCVLYYYKKSILKYRIILFLMLCFLAITILLHNVAINFIINKTLAPYQIQRLQTTFKPEKKNNDLTLKLKQRKSENYNVYQSIIAIGSGGFLGKGFLNNTQTRLDFVPEQSTDFIICAFAESFGFLGILVVLCLYLSLLLRILAIAEKQRSTFSRCYAYGFVSIVLFHLIVNIGMTVGLLPVIGIPLPFLSYGGGAMLTFSIMYFILIRLDIDRQIVVK